MTSLDRITYWVRARGRELTVSEIAEQFKFSVGEAITKINRLVEAGELIDHGGDRITAAPRKCDREPARAPKVQQQIWRAIVLTSVKGATWTAATIARRAEASRRYVLEYLGWLSKQGFVRAGPRPGKATIYRLHPDAPTAGKAPAWVNKRNRKLRAKKKKGK